LVINLEETHFEEAWRVFEQTASRDVFRLHPKAYYRRMIQAKEIERSRGREVCRAFLATASHEGEILAANVMIDFGDTRTYLHGASSNVKRNFMAPYLLHWELMKDAKSRGIAFYDWWGVAPIEADANHTWAGISRFKRGFGGEEISYPGTFDCVLRPWHYSIYHYLRTVRRAF
jgi:lipid II:glycine glycyltransferase (peptidoglycan interpeptide bridge formation enzyme)